MDQGAYHWYDFLCPFCYVAQHRNAILRSHGVDLVELPFQAHPDIPAGGVAAAPRGAPMYRMLEREAAAAGLPLHWPAHLPNSRRALAAAEWVRRHHPEVFAGIRQDLFAAHFALGEDIEDPKVIDRYAEHAGVPLDALDEALADGSAAQSVTDAETLGLQHGVQGTPAWLLGSKLVQGLRPAAEFERLAVVQHQHGGRR